MEDAAGGMTVQQMFREGNEEEFRNAEVKLRCICEFLARTWSKTLSVDVPFSFQPKFADFLLIFTMLTVELYLQTEVIMQLSSMGRLVVATGGGAVVRPQNW